MASPRPVLLVIDDEPEIIALVDRFARRLGFEVISRDGNRQVLAELATLHADAAMLDLQMPGVTGLEILRELRRADPACQAILMTGHASVESAIEAIKLGALDYVQKPLDFTRVGELLTGVKDGLERRRQRLSEDSRLAGQFEFCGMIGRSAVMQDLFDMIRRLAPHVRTALVTGETGTGKELVARALHTLGGRRERHFVTCNCSAIVESLFESELFGHTRGAFTGAVDAKPGLFERADGGTLFLDEIGELPLVMQAKLLRVVEYGEVQRVGATDSRRVDVRLIAATNRRLADEVAAGRFRQDLFYRLNVVEFTLPPLRERREDIPYLCAAFVKEFAKRFGKSVDGISAGAERQLQSAPWAGNIRELRNTLERACLLAEGDMISEREVVAALGGVTATPAPAASSVTEARESAADIDIDRVRQALQEAGGNISEAARKLGVSRRAFYRRLDTLGLRKASP